MKRFTALCLLLILALPAVAVENEAVMYVGGTVPGVKEGTVGRLDTSSPTALKFDSPGGSFEIPFARFDSYSYSEETARHLGVLPAVGVAILRKRQHRHFFRISFHDENSTPQVAILEVSKHMPKTVMAILQTRAPSACRSSVYNGCGQQWALR
jgi:hypothetical protein